MTPHEQLVHKVRTKIQCELHGRLSSGQAQWLKTARPNQLPPDGEWRIWLILAGRGFGKTRTGAETIQAWAESGSHRRMALVGATQQDVRAVMIEGESGLLAIRQNGYRPHFEPSKNLLTWPNGAQATLLSADRPDGLRGHQFDAAWVDEVCKFRDAEHVWRQLRLCLRLGDKPRVIMTTTPKPMKFLSRLSQDHSGDIIITRGSTYENKAHLSPDFISAIQQQVEGTRWGRQEIYGELMDYTTTSLWTGDIIARSRIATLPPFVRTVIGLDPAASCHDDSDETGIVVVGCDAKGHGYVIEDLSGRHPPSHWAEVVAEAARRHGAQHVIAEINKGGNMIAEMLRLQAPDVRLVEVHASKGKITRAEPIAALYEQGRIWHSNHGLELLEQQMLAFSPDMKKSPDRVDALVWALSELMLKPKGKVGVWGI